MARCLIAPIKRGEPATFGVNEVIPGWTEALQLMKVGDKWQLFVPSKLAYGPEGSQGAIPPDSTLIFEVELLEIVNPDAAPKAPQVIARVRGDPTPRCPRSPDSVSAGRTRALPS